MRKIVTLFIIFLISILSFKAFAQNVKIVTIPEKDNMVIRWGLPETCSITNLTFNLFRKTNHSRWEKIASIKPDISTLKNKLKNYPEIFNFLVNKNSKKDEDSQLLFILFYMKSITDKKLAQAAGIYYIDKNVSKNNDYFYKVEIVCNDKIIQKITSSKPVSLNLYKPPTPIHLTAKQIDKYVGLKWNEDNLYKIYFIYRDGNNLTPEGFYLSPNLKTKEFYYKDLSKLKTGKTYIYQIEGITLSGNRIKSKPIKIKIKDLIAPPAPENIKYKLINNKVLKLWWDPVNVKDLKHYNIYKAKTLVGPFKKVNSSPVTKSYFEQTIPKENYYFVVTSVDKAGNESKYSSPILVAVVDNIPPHKVKNLKAKIEDNKIALYWEKPKDKDLMGYKVYRRMGDKGKFILLTLKPITQEKFIDETLNKELDFVYIYYQVRAVDNSNNHSKPVTVKTKLPDTTPPPMPIITKYEITNKKPVKLYIQTSLKDVDKLKLLLTKQDYSKEKFIKVKSQDIKMELNDLPPGKINLKLTAIDKAGNESKPFNLTITIPKPEKKDKEKAKIKLKKDEKLCTISYSLPKDFFIYIYRNNIRITPALKEKGDFQTVCSNKKEIMIKLFDDKAVMVKEYKF